MEEAELSFVSRAGFLALAVFIAAYAQLVIYLDKSHFLAKKFGRDLAYWHYCVIFFIAIVGFFFLPDLVKLILAGIIFFLGIGYQIGKAKR
jgi:Na+/melibiose symporter-like transporter